MSEANVREIELSGGRMASIRPGKGRDLLLAARMSGGSSEPMKIAFGMIAALVSIDGHGLTIEEVEDLAMSDVLLLQGAVMGNGHS